MPVTSLAISVCIGPSRLLRLLLWACAGMYVVAALLLLTGAATVAWPQLVAACCMLGAARVVSAALGAEMKQRIDISGPGELRLTVQQSLGSRAAPGVEMQLLPGSTIWTRGLFLRLRPVDGGPERAVVILPDSMKECDFRAISVGIRSIAGRDNKFFKKHKIL